jgi:tetratricopeptide (TPR) repeat protein
LRDRNPNQAQNEFERATKLDPENIGAMQGMAEADIQRGRWGHAADWYDKILSIQPDHAGAEYGFAVCKREIGRISNPVQRLLEWRSSEKHFRQAMRLDSTYRDVVYQYALLEQYREHDEDAVELGLRQLEIQPNVWSGRVGIFRLYRSLLFNGSYTETGAWLKRRRTPYDRYFLGELYRRNERLDLADSIFKELLENPRGIPVQPVLLSRVRLLVQKGEPQAASDAYWHMVRSVRNDFDADFLREDLVFIMNNQEYLNFYRPEMWASVPVLLRAFWFRRNPVPSHSFNYRLIEHYRRLVHAEKYYAYDRFYRSTFLVDQKRTDFYRDRKLNIIEFPDSYFENTRVNDMGMIYIRYGEPDDEIKKVEGPSVAWLYQEREGMPRMIYFFESGTPGWWGLAADTQQPEMVADLVNWDERYYKIINGSDLDRNSLSHQLQEESVRIVQSGMNSDRQTWSRESQILRVTPSLDQFRQTETEDLIQLSYGIPVDALRLQVDRTDSIPVETAIEIYDNQLNPMFRDERRFRIAGESGPRIRNGCFIDEYQVVVPLRPCIVAFHALVSGTEILNSYRRYLALGDSSRGRLACSSLKIAHDIRPAGNAADRSRNALAITPNPLKAVKSTDPLHVYYEIYNLTLNEKGRTDYTMDFTLTGEGRTGIFNRLFGGGGKYRISIQNRQSGGSKTVVDYIGFDVRKAAPGKCELKLKIADHNASRETSVRTELTIE